MGTRPSGRRQPVLSTHLRRRGSSFVMETRVRQALDRDWEVEALLSQQDGTVVISELTIRPLQRGLKGGEPRTASRVPRGGLTSGTIRRVSVRELGDAVYRASLTISTDVEGLSRELTRIAHGDEAVLGDLLGDASDVSEAEVRSYASRHAANIDDWRELWEGILRSGLLGTPREPARQRPGRAGRLDAYYAVLAAQYVQEVETGGGWGVIARLLERRKREDPDSGWLTVEGLRQQVHAARSRGLLTSPPTGKAGGRLTKKALRILEAAARSQMTGKDG